VRLWLACVPTQHRPKEAAALWESLAQNHPFIDGNKRVAFAATYTFLAINGMRIAADAKAAYDFIAGLYEANAFTFENLVTWLSDNVARAREKQTRNSINLPISVTRTAAADCGKR
jgi:hypothetical protein